MFPANLLLLMLLLLPQASSGRQGRDAGHIHDHGRASSAPASLTPLLPSPPSSPPPTPTPPLPPPPPAVPEPSLSETIQGLLLKRLGLQSQPQPGPGVAVPQYLLDLYRFHQQQYHLVEDPAFSFPSRHVEQANTVRSFHHTEHLKKDGIAAEDPGRCTSPSMCPPSPRREAGLCGAAAFWNPRVSMGSGAHKLSLYLSEMKTGTGPGPGGEGSLGFVLEIGAENSTRPGYSSAVEPEEPERSGEGHLRVRRSLGQDEYSWAKRDPCW
ncbi:hypothetical protein CRUP_024610 [Coryphaenoides rupestris]|nr:hypothetical protein CRUP_024610 [Coryphaenoides rupestris]